MSKPTFSRIRWRIAVPMIFLLLVLHLYGIFYRFTSLSICGVTRKCCT